MLFRRRHKPSFWSSLRGWLWPRSGWRRAGIYIWHRLARLPGTPHSIAAGFASGVAMSFTPFLGLHILLSCGVAAIFRGNLLAAVIGTVIGNPWTFPLFFALTNKVGTLILGTDTNAHIPVWDWSALFNTPAMYLAEFIPVVFPLIIGGIPVAIIAWVFSYLVFKKLLTQYRKRKATHVNKRDVVGEDLHESI